MTALVTQTPGDRGQRSQRGHSDSTHEPRMSSRRRWHSTFDLPGAQQSGECSGILKCGSGIPLKSKHFVAERKSCREMWESGGVRSNTTLPNLVLTTFKLK